MKNIKSIVVLIALLTLSVTTTACYFSNSVTDEKEAQWLSDRISRIAETTVRENNDGKININELDKIFKRKVASFAMAYGFEEKYKITAGLRSAREKGFIDVEFQINSGNFSMGSTFTLDEQGNGGPNGI